MEKFTSLYQTVQRYIQNYPLLRTWLKPAYPQPSAWQPEPIIYEINTRVWLEALSTQYVRPITLANVPQSAIDELASYQVDAVWLMGVWTRSSAVRQSALNYMHEYQPVLPDLTTDDVIGSAYAIGKYVVDSACGGRDGLAVFRRQLADAGIKLILDYVPNHVAVDHPAIATHPDYFVLGDAEKHVSSPGTFFKTQDMHERDIYVAHGRDPYFPGWIDTAQLNAFSPSLRQATRDVLLDIAGQCDGVRCDMAMLLTNGVFEQTWGWAVSNPRPQVEFWEEIIPAVREQFPDFMFIAEVYWNMDYAMQQQGFDYTYDKDLYDRLFTADIGAIRQHLTADLSYMSRTVRFIENHDEGRAASAFGVEKSRPLAVLICTLPGAVLLHDGQFTGRTRKLPVQIGRQPSDAIEPPDNDLKAFYLHLLAEVRAEVYRAGDWWLFDVDDFAALSYGYRHQDSRRIVVINPHDHAKTVRIHIGAWVDHAEGLACEVRVGAGRTHYADGVLTVEIPAYTGTILSAVTVKEVAKAAPVPLEA